MKRISILVAAVAAVALGASGTAAMAAGGTITGTVKYAGTPPVRKQIEITKDIDVCGRKPHLTEDLIVGTGGGIKNAVVVVKGAKGALKPESIRFDQKGCDYVPHVLAFPAGSTVEIFNDDGIMHNIHTYSKLNPPFNVVQPWFKKEIKKVIAKPEIIKVACDAHGWMEGWWYATGTPYYAVTDDKGDFTIRNVPAGDYTIRVWQEKLGTEDQKAGVKDGATTTVNFAFKPKK
jgi:Carboxypeptidase regulatory-like domain